MKFTIFRKKVTPKNGNQQFYKYVTTLTSKTGEAFYCDVRFTNDCQIPAKFPVIVITDKRNANLTKKPYTYTNNDGQEVEAQRYTLWVSAIDSTEEYIDSSLDDFE